MQTNEPISGEDEGRGHFENGFDLSPSSINMQIANKMTILFILIS